MTGRASADAGSDLGAGSEEIPRSEDTTSRRSPQLGRGTALLVINSDHLGRPIWGDKLQQTMLDSMVTSQYTESAEFIPCLYSDVL